MSLHITRKTEVRLSDADAPIISGAASRSIAWTLVAGLSVAVALLSF